MNTDRKLLLASASTVLLLAGIGAILLLHGVHQAQAAENAAVKSLGHFYVVRYGHYVRFSGQTYAPEIALALCTASVLFAWALSAERPGQAIAWSALSLTCAAILFALTFHANGLVSSCFNQDSCAMPGLPSASQNTSNANHLTLAAMLLALVNLLGTTNAYLVAAQKRLWSELTSI